MLNHLNASALNYYSAKILARLAPALEGAPSALFCDSLELDTEALWDDRLYERFERRWGYRLQGEESQLKYDKGLLYDYRVVVAEALCQEFYQEFAQICRASKALSRVQCHGAPTDLLAAYSAVDIPESEAILFEPAFSRIPASAAAFGEKEVVSAEAFTCLYGFPSSSRPQLKALWRREQIGDLKLLADALFVNGVNQLVWHGMPFNGPNGTNEFYASVHVGPDAHFAKDLPAFNRYLTTVSQIMRLGKSESRIAMYFPNEDNWRRDRITEQERTPGANSRYEMRHVVVPRELECFAPLWISSPFLKRATVEMGSLLVGACRFEALFVDVNYLDGDALYEIHRLAELGLRIVMPRCPAPPGNATRSDYTELLDSLCRLPTVVKSISSLTISPIVEGLDLPAFWPRRTQECLYLFFANPATRNVHYPITFRQSYNHPAATRTLRIHAFEKTHRVTLSFAPHQSLLLRISKNNIDSIDIHYDIPAN